MERLFYVSLIQGAGPVLAQPPTLMPLSARTVFMDQKGPTIGTVTLIEPPNGVLIRAEAANLPRGRHGFHIHEVGRCDVQGSFESAGGHYNPTGSHHGYWQQGGPRAGDMANQTVGDDGKLLAEVFNPNLSFNVQPPLLDQDGSTLVGHAMADDYRGQPYGAAGDRIACGVIQRDR